MDCSKAYKAVCCRMPAFTPCPASAGSWHFTPLCNNWTNGVLKHGGFNGCIKLVPFVWLLIAGAVLAEYILNACTLLLSKLIVKSRFKCEVDKYSVLQHQHWTSLEASKIWATYWNQDWGRVLLPHLWNFKISLLVNCQSLTDIKSNSIHMKLGKAATELKFDLQHANHS